jgi:hypothetical protein
MEKEGNEDSQDNLNRDGHSHVKEGNTQRIPQFIVLQKTGKVIESYKGGRFTQAYPEKTQTKRIKEGKNGKSQNPEPSWKDKRILDGSVF